MVLSLTGFNWLGQASRGTVAQLVVLVVLLVVVVSKLGDLENRWVSL